MDQAEVDQLKLDLERLRTDALAADLIWLARVMGNVLEIVCAGDWPDGSTPRTIH
jgi:hypothetical protein